MYFDVLSLKSQRLFGLGILNYTFKNNVIDFITVSLDHFTL